ncbi:LPXTG cell wall anchor domain-containing protein [Atopobiaceae bacterium 24-176]
MGRILPVTGDVAFLAPVLGGLSAVALGATGALLARSRRRDG